MKFANLIPFCILIIVLVSACKPAENVKEEKEPVAEFGKTITFDYAAGFDNGTLFDTSFEEAAREAGIYNPNRVYEPVIIVFNKGSLFPGLEEAMLGMKQDDIKNIRIPPNKAYGLKIENSIRVLPKSLIKGTEEIEIGKMIEIVLPEGQRVPSYVKEIGEENITVDLNHPLAGEYIQFAIILKSIW